MSEEQKLSSMIKSAVADALKISAMECPDCHATFTEPARYMDHRIAEYMTTKIAEVKAPDPQEMVLQCKDGICKMVSEHVEATYDIKKKGEAVEEPPKEEKVIGLWDYDAEEEKE